MSTCMVISALVVIVMESNTKKQRRESFVFEYMGNEHAPKNVTHVKFHSSVAEVQDAAFRDCKQLVKVVFNEGLTKIGWRAFQSCSSLESIAFPSTLTDVEELAFYQCNSLTEVVLNEGLQTIGRRAFCFC